MSMEDFDDQIFNGDDREFSSFTYRIAAIKNLGRMMRLPNNGFPSDENVDKIESHLSNWRIHLPATKRNCLTEDCRLDEMMFQANMIINAYAALNSHEFPLELIADVFILIKSAARLCYTSPFLSWTPRQPGM